MEVPYASIPPLQFLSAFGKSNFSSLDNLSSAVRSIMSPSIKGTCGNAYLNGLDSGRQEACRCSLAPKRMHGG